MNRRAQGAFEYILLLAGVLLVVILAFVILRGGILTQANTQIAGSLETFAQLTTACNEFSELALDPAGATANLTLCQIVASAETVVILRSTPITFNGSTDSAPNMTFRVSGMSSIIELNVTAKTGAPLNMSEGNHCVDVYYGPHRIVYNLCGYLNYYNASWSQTSEAEFSGGTYENVTITDVVGSATLDFSNNNWYFSSAQSRPDARYEHNFLFDPVKNVSILFGGRTPDLKYLFNDTWWYNSTSNLWTDKTSTPAPSNRYGSAFAYDSVNGVFILFGGNQSYLGYSNETWSYNTTTNTWALLNPATAPSPRVDSAMTYDSGNGTFLLFGGYNGTNRFNETWEYNATANTWTNRNPPAAPEGRFLFDMAYDPVANLAVLFGGSSTLGGYQSDTWVYNATDNNWTKRTPNPAPGGHQQHAMTYDSATSLILLFGGQNSTGSLNDLWAYNTSANTWTQLTPASSPAIRYSQKIAYDSNHQVTVLFGGYGNDPGNWHLYNYTSNSWTEQPALTPLPSRSSGMSYDPVHKVVVLFGGYTKLRASGETWLFNPLLGNWTRASTTGPTRRHQTRMVYDPQLGKHVLFGGYNGTYVNDTWTYDVTTNTWTEVTPATSPPARNSHGMAYDSLRHRTILFGGGFGGGNYFNDTWAYNSTANTWTNLNPSVAPSKRSGGVMMYDPATDLMIYVSGYNGTLKFNETWAYNATANTWSPRAELGFDSIAYTTGTLPEGYFDSGRNLTIFFPTPGDQTADWSNITWAYNSTADTWSQIYLSNPLTGRHAFSPAFSTDLNQGVIYGGRIENGSFVYYGETWLFGRAYNSTGTLASSVFDAGANANWHSMSWSQTLSTGGSITLQGRGCANPDCSDGVYSAPASCGLATCNTALTETGKRYFQWKATLSTSLNITTPTLEEVNVQFGYTP